MRQTERLLARLGALLCLMAGCGQHAASVAGRVTLDGQPAGSGTVAFHPVSGGAVAYGVIQAGGSYALQTGQNQGLTPGEYQVTVQLIAPPTEDATRAPVSGMMTEAAGRLLSPPRYASLDTTPLRFKITSGRNSVDLKLTSQE